MDVVFVHGGELIHRTVPPRPHLEESPPHSAIFPVRARKRVEIAGMNHSTSQQMHLEVSLTTHGVDPPLQLQLEGTVVTDISTNTKRRAL